MPEHRPRRTGGDQEVRRVRPGPEQHVAGPREVPDREWSEDRPNRERHGQDEGAVRHGRQGAHVQLLPGRLRVHR